LDGGVYGRGLPGGPTGEDPHRHREEKSAKNRWVWVSGHGPHGSLVRKEDFEIPSSLRGPVKKVGF